MPVVGSWRTMRSARRVAALPPPPPVPTTRLAMNPAVATAATTTTTFVYNGTTYTNVTVNEIDVTRTGTASGTVVYDATAPSVSLQQAASQADPLGANSRPLT